MSGDHHPASLIEIEAWAEEALEERMDALRIVALIYWVHDLTGLKF